MCDPISLGLAGVATVDAAGTATAATAGSLASMSGVLGAAGSLASGVLGAASGFINSKALKAQADLQIAKGEFDAAQAARKYQRVQGEAVAHIGTTGIDLQSFSDVLADNTMEGALEVKAIKWGAARSAANLRFQSDAAAFNGAAALVGGMFGTAGKYREGQAKAAARGADVETGYGDIGYNEFRA